MKTCNRSLAGKHDGPVSGDEQGFLLPEVVHTALGFSGGEEEDLFARAFVHKALRAFWDTTCERRGVAARMPTFRERCGGLDHEAECYAHKVGVAASHLPLDSGAYNLSSLYVSLLPDLLRSQYGMFFTPPPLVDRLLNMVTEVGFDWTTGTVIDPACGGGAFVAPVARRMVQHLKKARPRIRKEVLVRHLTRRIHGVEIESFSAWMARSFLRLTVIEVLGIDVPELERAVEVADTMTIDRELHGQFGLVIGNPPYGKVTLPDGLREKYGRSLFGHANLYGIFTDVAVNLACEEGLIAYVTPTSFLGGQYFKNLRRLLREQAPLAAIDFVAQRNGVFADVLQETSLAVFHKGSTRRQVSVSCTTPLLGQSTSKVELLGKYWLHGEPESPWLLPRDSRHAALLRRAEGMRLHLDDLGYEVSTGPLVWNRYKDQLSKQPGKANFPLIWAESVQADGLFRFAHKKRNHEPYFHLLVGQDHLLAKTPCVLVQRTTAREQHRRIIAAPLPGDFVRRHGGVVVENHLNVVRPTNGSPLLDLATLAVLLNSTAIDELFRCISGSVAVSAYEIESMPLPSLDQLAGLQNLLRERKPRECVDDFISSLYGLT